MFIIVFSRRWGPIGLGFLVIAFLAWVGLGWVIRAVSHITATTGWWNVDSLIIGFGFGAFANWLFAVKVVEPRLDRPDDVPRPPSSTLFFLPLRHWTWAIVALGVVFLIPNVLDVLSR
jgi:hypothetical protein